MSTTPVRYSPSLEQPAPDEAETIKGLSDTITSIMETTSKDYGRAVRGVHAKGHGYIEGELEVAANLPPELAQGLFAQPGTYKALLRISTVPGDILDDSVSGPRGLALKVIDVPGARLPGTEGSNQDFILVNAPAFGAPTPKAFLGNLKMLASTTDKAEWAKKAVSGVLQTLEAGLEAVGGKSAALSTLGGAPNVHPLGETYYSQTAFRYGDHVAKFSLVPVSSLLIERTGDLVSTKNRPDALREDISEVFVEGGGEWELRVQLCTDLDAMPIEDASKAWDEKASPYVTVARVRAPHQPTFNVERMRIMDDEIRYSVWNGLAAHQPLGGVNRARTTPYEVSVAFRSRFNGCPIHEPNASISLPL